MDWPGVNRYFWKLDLSQICQAEEKGFILLLESEKFSNLTLTVCVKMQSCLLSPCPSEEVSEDCVGKGITNVLLCSITSSPPLFSIFSLWNICVCFAYCLLWLCPSWVPHLSAVLYAAQESARGENSSSQTSGFWECA